MKIQDIGGEFSLIKRLADIVRIERPEVLVGIGDDAAVLRVGPPQAPLLLVTTDLLVENQHFKRDWATPKQVGIKAAECNISDIAAMGGTPSWMFVSLALPEQIEVAWVEDLYHGLQHCCQKHGIALLGGDTTRGQLVSINITLMGFAPHEHLCLRNGANPGDLLLVTGPLGGSAACLAMLHQGFQPSDYLIRKHLTPQSRMDISPHIAPLASAMIDISDGLGSEVHHICKSSGVGAEIYATQVPIHPEVEKAAQKLSIDALSWAISGGEDFELLFSIGSDRYNQLVAQGLSATVVGHVTDRSDQITMINPDGRKEPLLGGFNHFL
jgi:thiamine-monophosphate kinase